jgi:outer membrane protein assembly factor BamB
MLLVTRVHSRRVLVLGAAGLVPAALVTLLLVHQPSIGDRRLYPTFRGSLALVGLGLALATLITWATAPNRLSRSSLTGLAWAGVTTILCIGPFLESSPRPRLYALDVKSGDLVWSHDNAWTAPTLVGDDLVVADVEHAAVVALEPDSGQERWSHPFDDTAEPRVDRALAAGAHGPVSDGAPLTSESAGISDRLDGDGWTQHFKGEEVLATARVGDSLYAYIATPGAAENRGGRIVKVNAASGVPIWVSALTEVVAVGEGQADIAASNDFVVVAGGERLAVLEAATGDEEWTKSVVSLGKSRGYALPGALQSVAIDDRRVYLSTTPQS